MEPKERREQILEHAAFLFGKNGYHATSITNIIESAGIARGTFYLYFKNKRAVFEELLDALVIQINSKIKTVEMDPGAPSPREQLVDNIVGVLELLTKNRALLSILLERAVGLDQRSAKKLADFYEKISHTIDGSIQLGQQMGLVRSCNTKMASLAAIGVLKEVLHDMLRTPEDNQRLREVAGEVLDIFSRGVLIDGVSLP